MCNFKKNRIACMHNSYFVMFISVLTKSVAAPWLWSDGQLPLNIHCWAPGFLDVSRLMHLGTACQLCASRGNGHSHQGPEKDSSFQEALGCFFCCWLPSYFPRRSAKAIRPGRIAYVLARPDIFLGGETTPPLQRSRGEALCQVCPRKTPEEIWP